MVKVAIHMFIIIVYTRRTVVCLRQIFLSLRSYHFGDAYFYLLEIISAEKKTEAN